VKACELFLKGSRSINLDHLMAERSDDEKTAPNCTRIVLALQRAVSPEFSIWYDNAVDERIDA